MAPDESSQTQTVDSDAANYGRTIAAVLLAFLRSLPESVVPLSLHQRCAECTSRDEALEVCHKQLASETTHMTPNKTSWRLFVPCIILDVVGFPPCICQRGSGPFLARFQSALRCLMTHFLGLDSFDGILARSSVEGPPPGRGSE